MPIDVDAGLLSPPPEYTVAAYLLMVAKSKGMEFKSDVSKNVGADFWEKVSKEMGEKTPTGLPSNWDDFLNPEFDCKTCHEALRKSFPAISA